MLKRRVLAFLVDYLIIVLYSLGLFLVSIFVYNLLDIDLNNLHPLQSQTLGFVTLTLPVFSYFYLCESSKHRATLGKRWQNISIKEGNVFLRNLLKLAPWEIAHSGVYWVIYFSDTEQTPIWVSVLLILPQIVVILYLISLITSKGRSTIYDKLAGVSWIIT